MDEQVVKRVAEAYGLAYQKILAPQKGYRNVSYPIVLKTGETVNLILYKSEPDILRKIGAAHAVSDFLASHGFPTRATIGQIARLKSGSIIKYGALYTYLPGSTIPWEAYTMAHLKLLGQAMSNMHRTLCSIDYRPPTHVVEEAMGVAQRMQRYFAGPDVANALATKLRLQITSGTLTLSTKLLPALKRLPGQQPIHMDFVRGNVLFDTPQKRLVITGILDFEKATYGHRVFDIARTLAFLLVDCKYKSEEQIRKYFLYSGYHKRGQLPYQKLFIKSGAGPIDVLEELITFFLLYDFYKFLRHNPYEFLRLNQHFIRTKEQLLQRGGISQL